MGGTGLLEFSNYRRRKSKQGRNLLKMIGWIWSCWVTEEKWANPATERMFCKHVKTKENCNLPTLFGWHDFFHFFDSMHFFLELHLIDIAQPSSWEDWIKVGMFVGFCPSVGSISLQNKIMQGLSQDKSTTFMTCIYWTLGWLFISLKDR